MAWNGTGTFQRVRNWVADAAAGIKIVAAYHDAEDDNFATGISNCIARDGQSTITSNIPFNNKRITGLADPVNPQDASTMASAVQKTGGGMTGDLSLLTGTLTAKKFQLADNIPNLAIAWDGASMVFTGGTGSTTYGFDFQNGLRTISWASIGPTGMRVAGTLAVNGAITSGGVPVTMKTDFDALLARIEALESRGT